MAAQRSSTFPRTLRIEIVEWGFSPGNRNSKQGEAVRLVVLNTGHMRREFLDTGIPPWGKTTTASDEGPCIPLLDVNVGRFEDLCFRRSPGSSIFFSGRRIRIAHLSRLLGYRMR